MQRSPATTGAFALATWFHVGRIGFAPGTMASLAALPLHILVAHAAPQSGWVFVLALTAAGVWASGRVQKEIGTDDPQCIVIDEVAGVSIAYWSAGLDSMALAVAFALFRGFDIFKPWPIGLCERLEPPGLGIMADDVVAGILAAAGTLAFVYARAA